MFSKSTIIFAVFMGFFTSLTITGVITVIKLGVDADLPLHWFQLWLLVYPIAVSCIIVYRPSANYLTQACLKYFN